MNTENFWNVVWSRKYERYNRHHQLIWETVFPYLKGKVVDLGCGPCVMYEGKDVDLTGIDWSFEALLCASKHYPKGKFFRALATATGLQQGQYDTVVMMGLLDYFDDWKPIIQEARRLVNKDGNILATLLYGFQNHLWTTELVKSKVDILEYKRICGNWIFIKIKN